MSWLAEVVLPPHTRGPLTLQSFTLDLLPIFLCYYATAFLVLMPDTFILRLALLPISLCSAFRASTRLDVALGYNDERLAYLNQGLLLMLTTISMRLIKWTFQRERFMRVKTQHLDAEGSASTAASTSFTTLVVDAADLVGNLRGLGWSWSKGLQVPPETRPTTSRSAFLVATIISLIKHIIAFDILHYTAQSFSPLTIGSPIGGTIFDPTLSPTLRYLRSSTITFVGGLTIYCAVATCYLVFTIIGVSVFRQKPSQWPPVFNSPWSATSLTDFWAKRWHQIFRDVFISLGGKPLSIIIGRVGGVFGAFLISGILHDIGLWGQGRGGDFQCVGGFFLIMGVGIVVEGIWKQTTGLRVDGTLGWIWVLLWVVGCGNILVDAWSKKGLLGSAFFATYLRPSTYIFGPLPH